MFNRNVFLAAGTIGVLSISIALPALSQQVLYNNGPDGDVGYYHVNFGAVVTNSFTLPQGATLSRATITIYDVDDGNNPLRVKWTITTEPFGGAVMGEGWVNLELLGSAYPTRFQFFAWPMGVPFSGLPLPAGTYYLQIQDVTTRFDTFAFWAQSSDGISQAYYEPVGQNGAGGVSQVPSEAFSILGTWDSEGDHARGGSSGSVLTESCSRGGSFTPGRWRRVISPAVP